MTRRGLMFVILMSGHVFVVMTVLVVMIVGMAVRQIPMSMFMIVIHYFHRGIATQTSATFTHTASFALSAHYNSC